MWITQDIKVIGVNKMERSYNDLSQKDLMNKIYQLKFAAVDLNLFLDNNPDNKRALDDYNTVSTRLNEVIDIYQLKFGPLSNFGGSQSTYPFAWVDEPWPWEIG